MLDHKSQWIYQEYRASITKKEVIHHLIRKIVYHLNIKVTKNLSAEIMKKGLFSKPNISPIKNHKLFLPNLPTRRIVESIKKHIYASTITTKPKSNCVLVKLLI